MDAANLQIVIGSGLLLLAILVSALVSRAGVPVLLAFLGLGMLAGEDGPGHIQFDDFHTTYVIGMFCLAVILFDGGLRTRVSRFRAGLRPALTLATVGVVLSAALMGLCIAWLFDAAFPQALLLGAIVGSTDAAAVFALLNARGMQLKERVAATLEIESGSNDPMAVFLTIAVIEALVSGRPLLSWALPVMFVKQMGLGAVFGIAGGYAVGALVNRVQLEEGLYPLLALAGGLTVFALTNWIGGSGILAIYLAGIVMGNRPLRGAQNIMRVQDGFAWLAQIVMFTTMGLLATPSELVQVAPAGMAAALALIFVVRPLAVAVSLLGYRVGWREKTFISWVGLRGAVPIVLAIFPLMAGVENGRLYLDVAFFVVLVSLLLQGWTIPVAARLLRLELPPVRPAVQRVELPIADGAGWELVTLRVLPGSALIGQPWSTLASAGEARLVGLGRAGRVVRPDEALNVEVGDFAYFMASTQEVDELAQLFATLPEDAPLSQRRFFGVFVLSGDAPLKAVADAYGLRAPAGPPDETIDAHFRRVFGRSLSVGDRLDLGSMELVVKRMEDGRVQEAGLVIRGEKLDRG